MSLDYLIGHGVTRHRVRESCVGVTATQSNNTVRFLPRRLSESEITSCGCQRPVMDGTFTIAKLPHYNITLQLLYRTDYGT